jgi:hypothetical protein
MVSFTADTMRRRRAEGLEPPLVPKNFNYMNTQTRKKERQKMIDDINKRRKTSNPSPNNVNKNNISTYYNSNFVNVESKNINNNKRVYISKDVINGRVKQVYNQDGIIDLLLRTETKEFAGRSPISRKKFWIKHVIPM